jgi:predicted enzyme related to lactoylglutathione lyase
MANISHFMIPADNVERARHFYSALLGWKIEPVQDTPGSPGMEAMQYHDISTGTARKGTLNSGGLYKRHMNETVLDFVEVVDLDTVLAMVEKLGGKIAMPKTDIPGVGLVVMILDSEGNAIGIWKPARK